MKANPGLKGNTRKINISLVVKVTVLIGVIIVAVSLSTNFLIFNMGLQAVKEQLQDKLMMLASNAAVTINAEELNSIKTPEDEGNPTYLKLQKHLQILKEASMGKIKYIYTVAKSGDKYIYVLDASPIEDTENHSSIGEEFDIDKYPESINGFSRPSVDKEPIKDEEFGLLQSGYAPIKDKNGQVIGMLGVDMDVSTVKKEEEQMVRARQAAFFLAFILAIILGVVFSRYLTKPILLLTKGTRRVAEGDLETAVQIKRNDEFGQLAVSFNAMTADLKASREALTRYNQELEEKVRQRTAELSEINKEIKDILDNMSQAIFTIDDKYVFNPQHSRYAYEIFGDVAFADRSLLDVFFGAEAQQNERNNMATWLQRVFSDTETGWSNLEPLQPVSEIEVKAKNRQGQDITKYIRIHFSPITELVAGLKQKTTKLMVIVQDISEEKRLAQEVERKEQEYRDNINQIVEVIKMDQEMFKDFIDECQERLVEFEPKLIRLREAKENMELVNDLFRIMHTLKGNARFFKLERIAGEAHSIENIFSGIRKGDQVMTDALLDECFRKLDRFTTIFNETMDIYNKIMQGSKIDTGKTRTEERKKEESEVIRVKVDELNRLAELIKKADRLVVDDNSLACMAPQKAVEIESVFKETQEQLESIRKVNIGKLFTRFPRMVRDIAGELGKKVKLITQGEEVQVDKNIFDKVGDPLVHIIRNSLDHGIEKPEDRVAAGKPEEGTIELKVDIHDAELLIEVRDDGKGLDIDRIKAKAVGKGLITPDKALTMPDNEAIHLIFAPGFSTNDQVTQISGRGVGMDVVKTSVETELNGTLSLESERNRGLRILMKIPLAS